MPDVAVGDDAVVGVVFNTSVHEVAVVAHVGQGVTRSGLGHVFALLLEFFPGKLVRLKFNT